MGGARRSARHLRSVRPRQVGDAARDASARHPARPSSAHHLPARRPRRVRPRRRHARHPDPIRAPHRRGRRARHLHHQLRERPRRQARRVAVRRRVARRGERAAQLWFQDLHLVPATVRPGAVPLRRHRHAVTEPLQGTDPLRRVPRRNGHRPGAHPVLPAGLNEGEQPHPLSTQRGGVLAVAGVVGRVPPDPGRPRLPG